MKPIILISDLHVNSTVGLWNPQTRLVDGGKYSPNKFQQWLWRNWKHFVDSVPQGSIVVLNGDWVQGVHPGKDQQIVTTSEQVQHTAAIDVVSELRDKASEFYVVKGTGFHDKVGGDSIEALARELNATEDNGFSHWTLWLEIQGKLIHFAHHISVAKNEMTPMAAESAQARDNAFSNGYPMPDLCVRSHIHQFHYYVDGRPNIVTTPGWQLRTEYLVKRNPQAVSAVGGVFLWLEKEGIRVEPKLYPLPKPRVLHSKN